MNEFHHHLEQEIPGLRRYARALTRNAIRADDLVQETLIRAHSLIGLIISLITCSNSLQASKNFPVPRLREFGGKALIEWWFPAPLPVSLS
jgi:hypothetical protein